MNIKKNDKNLKLLGIMTNKHQKVKRKCKIKQKYEERKN